MATSQGGNVPFSTKIMIEFEITFPLVEASSKYEKDHEAGFERFELQEKETEGEETLPELFVS